MNERPSFIIAKFATHLHALTLQKTVGQLREKARRALETGVATNYINSSEDGVGLGLSLLAGSARVIRSSTSKMSSTSAVTSATPSSATSSDSPPSAAPVGELHPTLLEDMNAVLERAEKSQMYFGGNDMSFQSSTTTSPGASNAAIGGISPSQQNDVFQTLMNYDNLNSTIQPHMYQNQIPNQVSVSEFDNLRQQQQQQQPVSMPISQMLTSMPYGYLSPMQQQQQQPQSQATTAPTPTPSWPDVMQGYTNAYPEENYPLVDDDGAWQNLVAGLGITT